MKKILDFLFNRWTKWELYQEDVPYTCTVYAPPMMGGYKTDEYTVYFDIYVRENKYTGLKKYKKIKKR